MTTKKVVADDAIGKVATKQWEIMRRVKEGTLSAPAVIASLQKIVENQIDRLEIETVNWNISSQCHDVVVRESADFVKAVKDLGCIWEHNNYQERPFILEGVSKNKRKARLRLAQLPAQTEGNERFPLVLRTYAELSGYELATSWDLLAFVSQSAVMRIVKRGAYIVALGDHGYTTYEESKARYYSFVTIEPCMERNNWSFRDVGMEETPHKLDCKHEVRGYILLRER